MPHKLPGAMPSPDSAFREEQLEGMTSFVDIDVPLVREQLRRAEIIKAARIYKQGPILEGAGGRREGRGEGERGGGKERGAGEGERGGGREGGVGGGGEGERYLV